MFYYTVKNEGISEYIAERSRFIGYVKPVENEQEAIDYIKSIKSKHHDAKHNCFAYVIRGGAKRYSDDGEPSGTAGLPMLDILQKQGIENTVVVVTRYFGGVLLGTGGLVRAYSSATKSALENAVVCKMVNALRYTLNCSYGEYDKIVRFLKDNSCEVVSSEFLQQVQVDFRVKEEFSDGICERIYDFTAGKISARYCSEDYICDTSGEIKF